MTDSSRRRFSNLLVPLSVTASLVGATCDISAGQAALSAVPVPLDPNIVIERLTTVQGDAVRLGYLPSQDALYYVRISGDIWRVERSTGVKERVAQASDHGQTGIWGFELTPSARFYLVSNDETRVETQATIVRGVLQGDEVIPDSWDVLAQSVRYPEAGDIFDHIFNAVKESADGRWIYVNSGSRTDHGEIQSNQGRFPGLREIPITSAILRLPADTTDLVLDNDEEFLTSNGFIWADGVRNTFDLEWGPEGRLFGVENSGDRDDSEEINWIREGHHYGFPWRIGLSDTPQQFADYDPSADPFIGPGASAPFTNDPTYPPPPEGVVFTDPILSTGPDADMFRDPADGSLVDASDAGMKIGSLTAHRSPLGLAFDNERALAEPYTGDGFVLSWSPGNSGLLGPMQDAGQDLLHITLHYIEGEDRYEAEVKQIAEGFFLPMDAVLVGNKMYVLEMRWNGNADLWELTFPPATATATEPRELPRGNLKVPSVFPNPFTGTARVSYSLQDAGMVRIELIDVTGRIVGILAEGFEAQGAHEVAVPDLAGGLYLLRVNANGQVATTTLVAVK